METSHLNIYYPFDTKFELSTMRLTRAWILALATLLTATVKANDTTPFVFTDEWVEYMKKVKTCMDEFNYTVEDLAKFSDYSKGGTDDNFKCFQLCQYKVFNVVKDGQLDDDALVKYHDATDNEKLKKIVLYCGRESEGTDDCDLAYNIEKCIIDNHKP